MMSIKELAAWNAVSVRVVSVKHGLLQQQSMTELSENHCFIFALGKAARAVVDETAYGVESNGLFHVPAGKRFHLASAEDEVEFFIVSYEVNALSHLGRGDVEALLCHHPFHRIQSFRTKDPAFFAAQLSRLYDAWRQGDSLSQLSVQASFYSVVHRFFLETMTHEAASLRPDPVHYVKEYLQAHYPTAISVQKLADALNITRSTLHEQFKRETGYSPQQYLMQLRLDAACRKLSSGVLSIDEIAASCGLRDQSYLSRVFKKRYGLAPGAFRRDPPQGTLPAATFSDAALPHPQASHVLIHSMGRLHRYDAVPRRIVCLDYGTAELCVSLGVGEHIVGVASAESALADCQEPYRLTIARLNFLSPRSSAGDVPDFAAICACRPELVIGTGFSFRRQNGVADAEDFEQRGIHVYALKATYVTGCNFESVYEDIRNLGAICGKEERAATLIRDMRAKASALAALPKRTPPVPVFVFDSAIGDKALTCGQSLENHIIEAAGGVNLFRHHPCQFVSVSWDEVAAANPRVILVHCFHSRQDGIQKVAFLKRVREIAATDAVQRQRFIPLGIKKIFPGLDCVDTACALARLWTVP